MEDDIQYAHIDHHRSLRKGSPEVIFGGGKTTRQIIDILEKLSFQAQVVLVTRVDAEKAHAFTRRFEHAVINAEAKMVICTFTPWEDLQLPAVRWENWLAAPVESAPRQKEEVEMYLVEKFAAGDLDDAEKLVREVMLLIEGCQTLALIHNNLDYIDAARHAALILVQNYQSTPAENVYPPKRQGPDHPTETCC